MNILSETSSDEKRAKKIFRKYALLKAKILETKSIHIGKNDYRMIGQQLIASPLFTHFEVVDEEGTRAPKRMEEKVYTYMSMLQIINHFKKIKPWLQEQDNQMERERNKSKSNVTDQQMYQIAKDIIHNSSDILKLLNELDEKTTELFKNNKWTEKLFLELLPKWNAFFKSYEQRLKQLSIFHTYVVENHLMREIETTFLDAVFKESHFNMHLFNETIPLHASFLTDINDFITLNGQLGRVEETPQIQEIIQQKERFYFHFFKVILYTLIAIQVVVSVLTFLNVLHITSVVTTFMLILMFFYIGYVNDRELLKTIETRLKTYRREQLPSIPVIRTTYKKQFNTYVQTEKNRRRKEKAYEFYVSLARMPKWFIFFGVAIFGLGLALLNVERGLNILPLGYLIVGTLLTILGIILPKTGLGKRIVLLEPGKITIQKKIYSTDDFTKVYMNKSQKKLFLHLTSIPDPMKYHIQKEYRNEAPIQIRSWCNQNYVSYE